jgi:hypothetical protein
VRGEPVEDGAHRDLEPREAGAAQVARDGPEPLKVTVERGRDGLFDETALPTTADGVFLSDRQAVVVLVEPALHGFVPERFDGRSSRLRIRVAAMPRQRSRDQSKATLPSEPQEEQ